MLNLLPPEQKQELRLNLLDQIAIRAAVSVISMVLVLVLLLLTGSLFLNTNLDETKKELSFWQSRVEIKELENLEKEVKELNKNLVLLDGAYKEQIKFSSFLEKLAEDIPAGIRLNNIYVEKSGRVNIGGHASTRDILLTLKSTLQNASYVSEFNFPLSNLTKTTDINFSLSFIYKRQ